MQKKDEKYFLSEHHHNEDGLKRKTDSVIYNFVREQYLKHGLSSGNAKENQYISVFDFVLQEGHFYKPQKLTRTETMIITDVTLRPKFKPEANACFYNSQLVVLEDAYHMLQYVEGFANNGSQTVLHAWCELKGKVIDITWKDENQFRLGMFSEKVGYYGVAIPTEKIRERVFTKENAGSLIDDKMGEYPLLRKKFSK
jgi:hypothetical protein